MQLLMVIEVDSALPPAPDEFLAAFGARREGRLNRFVFTDRGAAVKAATMLQARAADYAVFFRFKLTPAELRDHPAVFLGFASLNAVTEGVIDATACNGCRIFSDYTTDVTYVSQAVRDLLGPLARSTHFQPVPASDGSSWFEMNVDAHLNDPVRVPAPREVLPGDGTTIPVRGDGRAIISRKDAGLLRAEGMALSHHCEFNNAVHRWPPRIIASGMVAAALMKHRIDGLVQPLAVLLVEGSHWVTDQSLYDIGTN